MSMIPLWAKALIVAALLAACAWAIHLYNQSIRDDQRALDVAEYSAKLIAAQDDARAQEAAWQAKQKDIQRKANDEINKRDADYAALARTNDGLRNAAVNFSNGLPDDTVAACRARAATLADVFGECTEQLAEMGRAAQGQFIDAVACRQSWPE